MTLAPSSDFGIRGHEGKAYEVNEVCAVPHCGRASAHAHHLWSRSHLRGQPYEWVVLPDGTIIGNRVGLCREHHEWVTGGVGGHKARIEFRSGLFYWCERDRDERWSPLLGLLDPQPPGVRDGSRVITPAPEEVCPACGRGKRTKMNGKPRKTKTWTIDIPDDVEIGSDVLDGWVSDAANLLGFSDERSRLRRYHALAVVLAWWAQNRGNFVDDLKAAQ
jgi:hypothetical protein